MVPLTGAHGLFVVLRKEATLRNKVLYGCLEFRFGAFFDSNGLQSNNMLELYLLERRTDQLPLVSTVETTFEEGWTAEHQSAYLNKVALYVINVSMYVIAVKF